MIEVEVQHIALSRDAANDRFLILKAKDPSDNRICPIMIGHFEANAIITPTRDPNPKRPMTHDLLISAIRELGGSVEHVYIRSLEDKTFLADVTVRIGDELRDIDARPSDAIAIAMRARVPIYMADEVLEHVTSDIRSAEREREELEERRRLRRNEESAKPVTAEQREKMSAFSDLVESLSLEETEGDGPAARK